MGAAAQANYSAANATLDGLAVGLRAHGRGAITVQWGPWGEVGMASGGIVAERLKKSPYIPILPAVGMAALQALLRTYNPPVVCKMPIRWAGILGGLPQVPAFYATFAPQTKGAAAPARLISGPMDLSLVLQLVQGDK